MLLKDILNNLKSNKTETITNTNGTAIKFSDGTMICILNETVTDQAIDNAYGSIYQAQRVWTFPEMFIETPCVTCGMFKWGTSASWGSVNSITNQNASLIGYDYYQRATGTNVRISAIAIGRWK